MKKAEPFYLSVRWRALRAEALRRAGGRCAVDGCVEPAVVVDHVVARKAGGSDSLANLRCLCRRHDNQAHREKGSGGLRRTAARFTLPGVDVDGWPLNSAIVRNDTTAGGLSPGGRCRAVS